MTFPKYLTHILRKTILFMHRACTVNNYLQQILIYFLICQVMNLNFNVMRRYPIFIYSDCFEKFN